MTTGSLAAAPPLAPQLLARTERALLAVRLSLAMMAGCLLAVSVGLRFLLPEETPLADLVAGAAALLVAVPVLTAAWHSLRHPSLHGMTDRLVALALLAAWASGDLLTAALLPIIMIAGHVLEERSLLGSREAIRALSRLTETQTRRIAADDSIEIVPTDRLRPGDLIALRPGDRLPADGIVRQGTASLDMATLTGETVPVDVGPGDAALAGAIDTDGLLVVEVTRVGQHSTLGRIIALMQDAEHAKPPLTRLLDRHAGQYLTLVLLVAAGTWFATSNSAAMLAVLVASCPCALVLAAPATAVAAIAVAARHGILIKGSAFLEQLAEVNAVVFDKTGTITTGALQLAALEPEPAVDPQTLLHIAAGLGVASLHPVSRAAARTVTDPPVVTDIHEIGGLGVTGQLDGKRVALGRPDLFARLAVAASAPPTHDGPIAGVSCGAKFLGWLLFADQARPEAAAAVAELASLGLDHQILLTGDRAVVAERVAALVGIPEYCADSLPEQKMALVLAEIAAGNRPLVIGDGINDSLALKAGAVGIAMGAQGIEAALASADIVLMGNDLRRLATCIRLSRRCRRTIAVNVGIGLGWTAILIAAAAAGALGTEGAIVAALLHNVSTFLGLANSGRVLRFNELAP